MIQIPDFETEQELADWLQAHREAFEADLAQQMKEGKAKWADEVFPQLYNRPEVS